MRAVIAAALVGVFDLQGDRRARRAAFEHAGEDAHRIRLLPLGGEFGLAGAAAIEIGLDVGFAQRQAGRAAVDDAADGRTVAFAPRGDAEEMAEGVVAHWKKAVLF